MHEARKSRMQIMRNDSRNVLVDVYQIVPYAWDFLFLLSFFLKCYFKNTCFQLQQSVLWTNEMISASTSINGVRLAYYVS